MRQHRQIHLWLSESDYLLLREQSVEEQESVSGILRRLIRNERYRQRDEPSSPTGHAPLPEESDAENEAEHNAEDVAEPAGQRGPSHASVVSTGELTSQIAARSGW